MVQAGSTRREASLPSAAESRTRWYRERKPGTLFSVSRLSVFSVEGEKRIVATQISLLYLMYVFSVFSLSRNAVSAQRIDYIAE